jgi:hypothetical protein
MADSRSAACDGELENVRAAWRAVEAAFALPQADRDPQRLTAALAQFNKAGEALSACWNRHLENS